MIDEIYEVKQYLAGYNISMNNLYRICYLIVCFLKEEGLKRIEVRETLFEWGKTYDVHIKYNVNNIINRVYDSEAAIVLKFQEVRINNQDRYEIVRRFDDMATRKVALAMLCYAKAHAGTDGVFSVSSVGLGDWIGICRKTLRNKHIKELIKYEYLLEVSKPQNNMKWAQTYDAQSTRYKIKTPLVNSGAIQLIENNINLLFSNVFNGSFVV